MPTAWLNDRARAGWTAGTGGACAGSRM